MPSSVMDPTGAAQAPRSLILVCDDDDLMRFTMRTQLEDARFEVVEAQDGAEALALIPKESPECIVLDLVMPGIDGLGVLEALRKAGNDIPVVVVTATGGIEGAIAATRLGANAYLQKPFDPRELVLAVERALHDERLKRHVTVLKGRSRSQYGDFVGESHALEPLLTALRRLETLVAPTILITGESGTGKDVIARAIHDHGPRKDHVFVEIDCTALPEHLAESELFGHERGAFTDAKATKRGLLEVAAGGLVFLDEIGELIPALQAKLLRALENRTFKRVGGLANLRLDAGVIAATNRNLRKEVEAGRFREDLYYRLNVMTLHIPPLRERIDDLPNLIRHFLTRLNRDFNRTIDEVDGEAMALMTAYPWPGNVRELKNLLERIAILGTSTRIGVQDLPAEIRYGQRAGSATAAGRAESGEYTFLLPEGGVDLRTVDRELVLQALERTGGNQTAAAKLLGINRFKMRYRMERYGLLPSEGHHGEWDGETPLHVDPDDVDRTPPSATRRPHPA